MIYPAIKDHNQLEKILSKMIWPILCSCLVRIHVALCLAGAFDDTEGRDAQLLLALHCQFMLLGLLKWLPIKAIID